MPIALLIPALQLLNPMPGVVTRGVNEGHPALDIACITGTPVRAAHDGVGHVEHSATHGITFVLNGADGLETRYSHLQAAMPAGAYSQGARIGSCGNTGIWSSGPHLHFETNRIELLGSLLEDAPTSAGTDTAAAAEPATGGIGGTRDVLGSQR